MVSNSQLVTTLMLTKFSDLCSLVEFRMPKRVAWYFFHVHVCASRTHHVRYKNAKDVKPQIDKRSICTILLNFFSSKFTFIFLSFKWMLSALSSSCFLPTKMFETTNGFCINFLCRLMQHQSINHPITDNGLAMHQSSSFQKWQISKSFLGPRDPDQNEASS